MNLNFHVETMNISTIPNIYLDFDISVRRGHWRDSVIICAKLFDIDQKLLWDKLFMYCIEDIGPADPKQLLFVSAMHKLYLKNTKNFLSAITAAVSLSKSKKTRVNAWAFKIYGSSLNNTEVPDDIIEKFKRSFIARDLDTSLYWINLLSLGKKDIIKKASIAINVDKTNWSQLLVKTALLRDSVQDIAMFIAQLIHLRCEKFSLDYRIDNTAIDRSLERYVDTDVEHNISTVERSFEYYVKVYAVLENEDDIWTYLSQFYLFTSLKERKMEYLMNDVYPNYPSGTIKTMTVRQNAFVTLVMFDDRYIPGALALAQSLRNVGSQSDLICMVTDDVSVDAVFALNAIYDVVIRVEKIQKKFRGLFGIKQNEIYGDEFLSTVFTKWRCLEFTRYSKVCFVDADVLFLKNPDDIFDLPAPAGSFINPWSTPPEGLYGDLKHREQIDSNVIEKSLYINDTRDFVVFGSFVLLEPSMEAVEMMHSILDEHDVYATNLGTKSGPDELLISETFLRMKIPWTNISIKYHLIWWKYEQRRYGEQGRRITKNNIIGLHYFNKEKPWLRAEKDWESYYDLTFWFKTRNDLRREANMKRSDITWKKMIPFLEDPGRTMCVTITDDVKTDIDSIEEHQTLKSTPEPVRVRIRGGKVVQDCDVYVGRSCTMGGWSKVEKVKKGNKKWKNPFNPKQKKYSHLGKSEKLQQVLKDYEDHIRKMIRDDPTMIDELRSFGGKTLGCFCSDSGTIEYPLCHATIICKLFVELEKTGNISVE